MPAFFNPFAAFVSGVQEGQARQEEQRRRDVEEKRVADELVMRQAADKRAADAAALQAQVTQANLDKQMRETALQDLNLAGVGGELQGDAKTRVQKFLPAMVSVMPQEVTQGAQIGEDENGVPQYEVKTTPERVISKGTPQQIAIQNILDNPDLGDEQKAAVLMQAGVDINSAEAKMLMGEPKTTTLLFDPVKRMLFQQDEKGEYTKPFVGQLSEKYKILNAHDPNQNQGMPFAGFAFNSGQGLLGLTFNKETGGWEQTRIADTRPGEGAQKDISNAMGVNSLIDKIKGEYTPAKIGVIMGRLNNLDQKYWGNDPDYATLKQNLTTLGNTIIQLRTGAQMSVQEAERILAEVASETLPPATFMARLNELEKQYDQYLANRAKIAFGRVTPDEVTGMVNGAAPTATGTTPAPTSTAKPAEWEVVNGVRMRKKAAQ